MLLKVSFELSVTVIAFEETTASAFCPIGRFELVTKLNERLPLAFSALELTLIFMPFITSLADATLGAS